MIRTIFILALLFAQHGRTTRDEKVTPMATIHKWVSSTGDMDSAASYASGIAPHGAAVATVTAASVLAADTVTVNGLVYTAVSGAKSNNTEFRMDSGGDDGTGTDLADSITNDARTGTDVPTIDQTASSTSAVVTITAGTQGVVGNSILLSSSNGTRLAVSDASLVAPVAWATDDTFRMDDSSVVSISTNQDIMSDVTIARWAIHESYTGDLGSSAVRCNLATTFLDHSGGGTLWYDGVTLYVTVDSVNNANAADVNGTITELHVTRGNVTAAPTNAMTFAQATGFNANLTLNAGGSTVERVHVGRGARMLLNRPLLAEGELVSMGELTDTVLFGNGGTGYASGAGPTMYLLDGGTYKPTGTYGSVVDVSPFLYVLGGTFDLSESTSSQIAADIIGPSVDIIENEGTTGAGASTRDLRKPFP